MLGWRGIRDAMAERPIPYWQSQNTADAARLAEQDPVVVLPVAAVEQHGPHLPLSTDLDIGLGILACAFAHLPDEFPALVLPPQSVGSSREHVRFPGTLTVDPELLAEVIYQHGLAVASCGVNRLVLSNSHGGNCDSLHMAGLRLREEQGLLVVTANYFLFPRPDDVELPETEWRHGLHGGTVETAMMLHLRPELVRTEERRSAPSFGEELDTTMRRLTAEGEAASFSWLAGDLNSSGVVGDATLGDAAMGARLVEHYGRALAEVILDTKGFPVERFV